jgi:hypothetical protein
MKRTIIVALPCAIGANSPLAQSTPTRATAPTGMEDGAATVPLQLTAGQWVPPDETSNKARAQVYGELIEAQQDGQLAYPNKTLYAHY